MPGTLLADDIEALAEQMGSRGRRTAPMRRDR